MYIYVYVYMLYIYIIIGTPGIPASQRWSGGPSSLVRGAKKTKLPTTPD